MASKGTKALCGSGLTTGPGSCRREAGWGTDHLGFGHCKWHGGASPAGIKFAATQMAMSREVQYGAPIQVDPHTVLLEEVYRAAGHVEFLRKKVIELVDTEMIETNIGGKTTNFWITWYRMERRSLVEAAATCIKAGVAERAVRVAEEQGRMLAEAVRLILAGLGLSPEQQRAAPGVIRNVLMQLDTGTPAIEVGGTDRGETP